MKSYDFYDRERNNIKLLVAEIKKPNLANFSTINVKDSTDFIEVVNKWNYPVFVDSNDVLYFFTSVGTFVYVGNIVQRNTKKDLYECLKEAMTSVKEENYDEALINLRTIYEDWESVIGGE